MGRVADAGDDNDIKGLVHHIILRTDPVLDKCESPVKTPCRGQCFT
jgi:hypothetical protein